MQSVFATELPTTPVRHRMALAPGGVPRMLRQRSEERLIAVRHGEVELGTHDVRVERALMSGCH